MKNRRIWAWLLLALFLLGLVGAGYAFFARNNAVVGISVACIVLSALGTYYLRQAADEEEREQDEKTEKDGRE